MVWLYLCKACEEGNHGACEIGHRCPPGQYGGDKCRCPCAGQADWNSPERIERELMELLERMMDHNKAVEEVQRINKLAEITRPNQVDKKP